jgi:hypothetical protein
MLQEILMWCSVGGAFGYTFYSLAKIIRNAYLGKGTACGGSCSGCSAKKDLMKQIEYKNLKPIKS